MNANSIFNLRRFLYLLRWQFATGKRNNLLSVLMLSVIYFLVILFSLFSNKYTSNEGFWITLFFILTVTPSILISGNAFALFRTKEGKIDYLTAPASNLEKYIVEFLTKYLAVWIITPLVFRITASSAFYILKWISPDATVKFFRFDFLFHSTVIESLLFIFFVAFAQSLAFAGAAAFGKQPLIKTIAFVGTIISMIICYLYVIYEVLKLNRDPFFLKYFDHNESKVFVLSLLSFSILCVFSFAFFKLKEKQIS